MGQFYYGRIPDEPISCPCKEAIQARLHILSECPRYEQYRHILRKVSPTISLPTILGTTKGIFALTEFIEKTGAFTKEGSPWRHSQ